MEVFYMDYPREYQEGVSLEFLVLLVIFFALVLNGLAE
jgi:hypothetical protein